MKKDTPNKVVYMRINPLIEQRVAHSCKVKNAFQNSFCTTNALEEPSLCPRLLDSLSAIVYIFSSGHQRHMELSSDL
ncbi:hypothetical protein GOP47_0012642 [Adiantum capillus-veneris]|uniref:Uncharacterized protein n=1 Tax=Adiantum capillus-veneris TaxID=13818 RepID=A0A9D4ZH08_ADICA|nr:hypothetical protein GOP47_0012642 [Adiantum capillus-veneris]